MATLILNNGWRLHPQYGWVYPSSVWYWMGSPERSAMINYWCDGGSLEPNGAGRTYTYESSYTHGIVYDADLGTAWRWRWIWQGVYLAVPDDDYLTALLRERWFRVQEHF